MPGFYLEFQVPVGEEEALKRLENRQRHIELVAVRRATEEGAAGTLTATVFVPEQRSTHFLERVEAYRTEETRTGHPRNEALVARLEGVRIGSARSLFTDDPTLFPQPHSQTWWEIWLRIGTRSHFAAAAHRLEVPTKEHALIFPEREVVLARATLETLERLLKNTDAVAELRIAKDLPGVFRSMTARDQVALADDVVARLIRSDDSRVAVCLLDAGVTRGHPMIEPCLSEDDQHTCDAAWGIDDRSGKAAGHGTGMAGIAVYGDFTEILGGNRSVVVAHCLESVKILPRTGFNEPDSYGWITQDAISRAEIQAPRRSRIICLAVSNPDQIHEGRPTAWSAALDQLAFGRDEQSRLLVVSAGNVRDEITPADYPDRNDTEGVESPAQSWNALTVGACTEKVNRDPA